MKPVSGFLDAMVVIDVYHLTITKTKMGLFGNYPLVIPDNGFYLSNFINLKLSGFVLNHNRGDVIYILFLLINSE